MSKAEEKSLKAYPEKIEWVDNQWDGAPFDINCEKRFGYQQGYHQAEKDFLDNIWHSPDEEPEIDRKIIWESENFLGKHLDGEWKPKIDCFGREERWCYLADILPSKNWTGERPYSKVDYSRGYDNGYKQAEKDLALTWRDIADIENIITEILKECDNKILYDTEEGFCQEVLKRFKERKVE